MSRIEAYATFGIAPNRVDFPVSANTVHCIKTAWIFRNFPGRTNNFNELQIVANAKKPCGPEDIRRRETRELHGHGARAFGSMLRVEAETAPTTVLPSSSSVRAPQAYALLAWKETEKDTEKLPPHTADRVAIPGIKETTPMSTDEIITTTIIRLMASRDRGFRKTTYCSVRAANTGRQWEVASVPRLRRSLIWRLRSASRTPLRRPPPPPSHSHRRRQHRRAP